MLDKDAQIAARRHQTRVGLALAGLVIGAWVAAHLLAVLVVDWRTMPLVAAPVMIAFLTWLSVGLFIVAHDAMHGSLAPGRPAVNRTIGRLCLWLYAGFSYDRLLPEHHKHHRRPGTADDPDFDPDHPDAFWPWFVRFMQHYFGWREFAMLVGTLALYMMVLRPELWQLLAFFALPAILSAVQLFYFGTYLPHRREAAPFDDRHNSRTNDYPYLLSLLTCFHFGYHHEHHLSPTTPWWRLPALRGARQENEAEAAHG